MNAEFDIQEANPLKTLPIIDAEQDDPQNDPGQDDILDDSEDDGTFDDSEQVIIKEPGRVRPSKVIYAGRVE